MDKEIIIDAKRQKLGHVASLVAKSLRGKTTPDFLPNRTTFPKIIVKNVDAIDINVRRLKKTTYQTYSGYPGGRTVHSMLELAEKDMTELLKHAVWGMLPKNKLKNVMIKNLILYHGDYK